MTNPEIKKPLPAYLAFETFKNFVQTLKETIVPGRIDKSLMPNLAGGVQSHLMGALRFLRLIGDTDADKDMVKPALSELVEAFNSDRWPMALRKVVEVAYKPITDQIDIATVSQKGLDDAFKKVFALDGSMLDRALRFYLRCLKDAEVRYSPHVGKKKPRTLGKRPNGGKANRQTPDLPIPDDENSVPDPPPPPKRDDPPPGTMVYPIYFRGGKVQGKLIVPTQLTTEDVTMIELLIPMLRAYASPAGVNK